MLNSDHEVVYKPSDLDIQATQNALAKTPQQLIRDLNSIQTEAQEIETDLINNIEKVRIIENLPQAEVQRNSRKMNNLNRPNGIVDTVQQTIAAIKLPGQSRIVIPQNSEHFLRDLALSIGDIEKINERNAVLLNKLIRLALEDKLNTPDEIIQAYEAVQALAYFNQGHDRKVYFDVVRGLQEQAKERIQDNAILEATLERINTPELKKLERIKRQKDRIDNVRSTIALVLDEKMKEGHNKIDTMFIVNINPNDPTEENKIRALLKKQFGSIFSTYNKPPPKDIKDMSPEERDVWRRSESVRIVSVDEITTNVRVFQKMLNDYYSAGKVSEADYEYLFETAQSFSLNADQYTEYAKMSLHNPGERLIATATETMKKLGRDEDSPEMKLLESFVDTDKFYKLIHDRYHDFSGESEKVAEYWEKFTTDVRSLFELLFINAESSPKDFWDRSFNDFYEGNLYRQLVSTLRGLGDDVLRTERKGIKVQVKDLYAEHERLHVEQSDIGANPSLQQTKLIELDLGQAIQTALTNEMIDYKEFTEFAHNINALTQNGLGFSKLSEYSVRIRMQDIDRIFKSTPGLSEVYSFYLENMLMSLSLNNHIFPREFGELSLVDNLDPIEQMTFQQYLAHYGINENEEGEVIPKILRLVRKSSALTKGVFGEFWGTAWTAIMNQQAPIEFTGKEIKYRKSDGSIETRSEVKYRMLATYMSLGSREIEKILTSLDADLTGKRFNQLPSSHPNVRDAFIPRDLHHPPPEFYWYTHGDIMEYYEERDAAFVAGRTDKLIRADDKYEFASENFRTSSIDYALRGSWRYYDYRRFLVYSYKYDENGVLVRNPRTSKPEYQHNTANNKLVVDFDASMRQMQGVGPYIIKTFIDDIFAGSAEYVNGVPELTVDHIGQDIIRRYEHQLKHASRYNSAWHDNHHWRLGEKLDDDQKKVLKLLFYQTYILEPLLRTRPTHFITMEHKRWIPRDEFEEHRTTNQRLRATMQEMYPDLPENIITTHMIPLYIGALQLAEFEESEKRLKLWKSYRTEGEYYPGVNIEQKANLANSQNPLDYTFTVDMLDVDEERKNKILNYYRRRLRFIGKKLEPRSEQIDISDERFFEQLRTFYQALNSSLHEDRWHENRHNPTPTSGIYEFKPREVLDNLKETLPERYANMLIKGQGNIEYYLKGNLTNMKELYFSTSGVRGPERMLGESMAIAEKVTTNIVKIYYENIDTLVRRGYKDIHEWEQAVTKLVAEPMHEIAQAITGLDYNQAMGYVTKHTGFLLGLIREDRFYTNWWLLGPLVGNFERRWHKNETGTSYMTSKIPSSMRSPSTAANTDQQAAFIHVIGETVGMKRTELNVVGKKPFTIFGKRVPWLSDKLKGEPIYDGKKNEHYIEKMMHAYGVHPKARFLDSLPIIGPAVILVIFLLLAKLAADKEKKK